MLARLSRNRKFKFEWMQLFLLVVSFFLLASWLSPTSYSAKKEEQPALKSESVEVDRGHKMKKDSFNEGQDEIEEESECFISTVCTMFSDISKVHQQNRCILNKVRNWIIRSDWENAVFNYGLPASIYDVVGNDVGPKVTLSDLVSYLATQFGEDTHYMEMGVSVGKTLYQVLGIACQADIIAFDIEKINPTFEKILEPYFIESKIEENIQGHDFGNKKNYESFKKDDCSLTKYKLDLRNNGFHYLNCDEFDRLGWKRLKELVSGFPKRPTLQVVFSDALHTFEAVRFEVEQVLSYELLDRENFAYVWDDASFSIQSFCDKIVKYASDAVKNRITCASGRLPGWQGINERNHQVALVTTIDIKQILESHFQNVKYFRQP